MKMKKDVSFIRNMAGCAEFLMIHTASDTTRSAVSAKPKSSIIPIGMLRLQDAERSGSAMTANTVRNRVNFSMYN